MPTLDSILPSWSLRLLREPLAELTDPSHRLYWGYLLGSLVLGLAALMVQGARWRRGLAALLDRRIWLHPSALADYRLIALRTGLGVLGFGLGKLSVVALAAASANWLHGRLGPSSLQLSPWLVALLVTLATFFVQDWTRYAVHRAMHRIPWLWEFHKVHHSAEVMTPLTLYRTHPVEAFLNRLRNVLALGLSMGVCVWAFGPKLQAWELLGVDALGFLWTLLGSNLRHSHVWISYGPRIERWLMSPAQHQIHHSRDPRHWDRNFGTMLSLWDWIDGSLYVTRERERLRFGLPDEDPSSRTSAVAMLYQPFVAIGRSLWPRRGQAVAATLEPEPAQSPSALPLASVEACSAENSLPSQVKNAAV